MRYLTVLYMNDRPTNITHPFNRKTDAITYANYLGDSYRVMSEDEYRKAYEKTLSVSKMGGNRNHKLEAEK